MPSLFGLWIAIKRVIQSDNAMGNSLLSVHSGEQWPMNTLFRREERRFMLHQDTQFQPQGTRTQAQRMFTTTSLFNAQTLSKGYPENMRCVSDTKQMRKPHQSVKVMMTHPA